MLFIARVGSVAFGSVAGVAGFLLPVLVLVLVLVLALVLVLVQVLLLLLVLLLLVLKERKPRTLTVPHLGRGVGTIRSG